MRKIIFTILIIVSVTVFFIFYENEVFSSYKSQIENTAKSLNHKTLTSVSGDTLILFLPLSKLECENLPSYIVLRDLLLYRIAEKFEKSNFYYLKIIANEGANKGIIIFENVFSKTEVNEIYFLHKNCIQVLKIKEYIYFNCDIKWVEQGNTILISLYKQDESFKKLELSKFNSYPDIISVLIGYGFDCCNMKMSDNITILKYLEIENNSNPKFSNAWSNYGSHVSNIIKLCYSGNG